MKLDLYAIMDDAEAKCKQLNDYPPDSDFKAIRSTQVQALAMAIVEAINNYNPQSDETK